MSRERLTDKVAGDVTNDVYVNESRSEGDKNPGKKYDVGGPSEFAEDPDMKDPAKDDDKRNDMNIGDMRNANEEHIKNAREMERKAVKCIVASQRMLPGMDEQTIEANALDLMSLPTASINSVLARQEELARSVQAKVEEVVDPAEGEEKEAKEECEAPAEAEEKEAKEDCETPAEEEKEAAEEPSKEASQEDLKSMIASAVQEALAAEKQAAEAPAEEEAEEKEAKEEAPAEEEAEEKEAKEEEPAEAEEKEASEETVLDTIFSGITASDKKSGATSLTGLVSKQASESGSPLEKIWKGAPDISSSFE